MRSVDFLSPIRRRSPLNKGLLRWWLAEPKRNASPRLRDLTSKSPVTLSGALRLGQRARVGGSGSSVFDGTDDYGQTATIDLSGISTMSIALWLYWDAFADDNDMLIESSADSSAAARQGAISILPNSSTTAFVVRVNASGSLFNSYRFPRPSAATWHHYVFCYDRNGGAQQITAVYVDGVSQTLTSVATNATSAGGFGNWQWNFLSRNATTLFGAGRLDDIRIYNRVLRAWEPRALMNASRRGYPNELRWSRGAEFTAEEVAATAAFNYYNRRRRNA